MSEETIPTLTAPIQDDETAKSIDAGISENAESDDVHDQIPAQTRPSADVEFELKSLTSEKEDHGEGEVGDGIEGDGEDGEDGEAEHQADETQDQEMKPKKKYLRDIEIEIESDEEEWDLDEMEMREGEEISEDSFDEFLEISEEMSMEQPSAIKVDEAKKLKEDLQIKLDRDKILEGLRELSTIRQKEERKNFLLNKKLVEYFRRKKSSRALQEDNADIVYEFMAKYRNLLFKLDRLKGQEETLKKQSVMKLNLLAEEKEKIRSETNANIAELNKHLRDVGITCQSTKTGALLSEKAVEKYVRKMTLLRDQISTVRLELLKMQDKITALFLKAKQLEDLGDGLKVINFEQLRAETQSLNDKIEERNNELTKLRRRCNSDIHILAHVREKQFTLSSTTVVQEGVLNDLKNEELSCRNYLNYIKLERDKLRKKLKEMSYECGLLDKPALLRDYDRTVEQIEQVKNDIADLNSQKERVTNELKMVSVQFEHRVVVKNDMQRFDEALNRELDNLDKLPYPRIKQGIKPVREIDLSRYRFG